jgi:hypothetical protein
MKTKTFFLICFFLGIGLTQLSAQKGKNGNGAVVTDFIWDGYYIDIPVVCGEALVDRIVGIASSHLISFYVDGIKVGEKEKFSGQVTNSRTGEIFEIKDIYISDFEDMGGNGHWNLNGDQGSHYIIFYSYDWGSDSFTFLKANCH